MSAAGHDERWFEGRHGRGDVPWSRRVWRNHLSFAGRTGRRAFFVRVFLIVLTLVILGLCEVAARWIVAGLAAVPAGPARMDAADGATLAARLGFLALRLVCLWSFASLVARRLHDCGNAGWWALPVLAASGALVAGAVHAGLMTTAEAAGLGTPVILVVCVLVGSRPGTQGSNRYGERADPHEEPRRELPPPDVFT